MDAPRRIAIIGPSAAGKSTLAARLGEKLSLPVHHLDSLYWRPGWTPTPSNEWNRRHAAILAEPEWIVDGNFSASMRERIQAADTVVFLDLPRRLSLFALVRRRLLHRWRRAPGMQAGSKPMFNAQSFRWIWTFPHDHRPDILALLAEAAVDTNVVVLRSRRDVRRFLRDL